MHRLSTGSRSDQGHAGEVGGQKGPHNLVASQNTGCVGAGGGILPQEDLGGGA